MRVDELIRVFDEVTEEERAQRVLSSRTLRGHKMAAVVGKATRKRDGNAGGTAKGRKGGSGEGCGVRPPGSDAGQDSGDT